MKKLAIIISIYALLIYLILLGAVHIFLDLPELIKGSESAYRMAAVNTGFFTVLPPVIISGFAVACAVTWKKQEYSKAVRFSQAQFNRYKIVFIISLILVFILSLNEEIFVRSMERKMKGMEEGPARLETTIETTKSLLNQGHSYLALQYANEALKLAPHDEEVISLVKNVKDAVDIQHDQRFFKKIKENRISRPIHDEHKGYTILQLLEKSSRAAEKKMWFDAHYWAQLAVDACDGTNTNLQEAKKAANHAWKQLNLPVEFDNSMEREYYSKKKEGYKAWVSGDILKAYYVFTGLSSISKENSRDPDVVRFLDLAKEAVENQYFFIDETDNMNELADSSNIYFSLAYPDGTKSVFYIGRTMDIKRDGSLVRYLEDFNVIHYSSSGNLLYSFRVPYTKAVAQPVSEFDETSFALLGIEKKWSSVPVITLQSVDRTTEGIVSKPEYSFDNQGLPESIIEELGLRDFSDKESLTSVNSFAKVPQSTMMVLPMPFNDFHLINEASSGASNMTLLSLYKFLPNAVEYGFSREVFTESLVQRVTYPFIVFILLIFAACIGWNYRIDNPKEMFKFKWLFFVPGFGLVTVFVFSGFNYLFSMVNYIFVGIFGTASLLCALVFYGIILFIISFVFVSRKS